MLPILTAHLRVADRLRKEKPHRGWNGKTSIPSQIGFCIVSRDRKGREMSIITIVGAGMMGSAMSRPATDNGHRVRLVGTPLDRAIIDSIRTSGYHPTLRRQMPESVEACQVEELDRALEGADLVIGGVSSFGVEWFADHVLPKLRMNVPVLSITKGLNGGGDGELIPFPHHLESRLPPEKRGRIPFCAVGGPCISFELADRRHTMVVFCGSDGRAVSKVRRMLTTGYYHVSESTDVAGVEGCAALKNAYAMGVSLAVGIADREVGELDSESAKALCSPGAPDRNPVYNPQAALFAQSCLEMSRIVRLLGGDETLAGVLPGAGDLFVTIFGGRTRRLGSLLGRGIPFPEAREMLHNVTLEAVAIIRCVSRALRLRAERGEVRLSDFPLLFHMEAVLEGGAPPEPPYALFGETGKSACPAE